jgi:hypothetical protein
MNFISNFYKLLIVISLIIILTKLINNMYEKFSDNKILFNIKKFNNNSVELTWSKDKDIDNIIRKYVIIKYINNNGPYLSVINNKSNRHIVDNIQDNIIYKIGIVSIDKTNKVSNIEDNIKQFTFSSFNDTPEVKYTNSFKNNIYCDPKGQHKLIGKCPNNNDNINIIATNKLSKEGEGINYFSHKLHETLMDNLEKPSDDIIGFELKI